VSAAQRYETSHYAVSMNIGEHDLLPLVRRQGRDTLMISDGFSCRFQMKHGAGRWALHPAETILLAREARGATAVEDMETRYLEPG
jgi:hypothetical protein